MNCRGLAYFSLVVAVLGTFLQNYATSVIAGVICFACREFDLSSIQSGWLAGMIFLGALFGSLLAGPLADLIGRKKVLFFSALFYVISNAPFLFVSTYSLSLFLRFLTGIAVGITSLIVPLYLAEIAPPSRRGAFVATSSMCAAVGILIAYLINWIFADSKDWRSMLFVVSIPAVLQAIVIFFISESPSWFFKQGKIKEGIAVMSRLHFEPNVFAKKAAVGPSDWKSIFHPRFRKGLWIGIAVMLLQQGSGINAVLSFTHFIFQRAGINQQMSTMFLTFLLGLINLFAAILALFLIDHLGRRKLLLFSQMGIILSLSLVILRSVFELSPFLSIGAVILFMVTYSFGLGPIPWVLVSEIYPVSIRALALAFMTFLSWLSSFVVVLLFPYFLALLGANWTFFGFLLMSIGGLVLFWRIIPETKGKSFDEIERSLY